MGGMIGWVDFERDLTLQERVLTVMTDTLQLRGPDGQGLWVSKNAAFGHRRRSPTDGVSRDQPCRIIGAHGELVVTFTGEIHNHAELRDLLLSAGHRFDSDNQAELVGRAWLAWGRDCPARLNGIFAIAIWDVRTSRLTLIRDRMGIQPLYYHRFGNALLLGSEPKALLANPHFQPRLARSSLTILLQPRMALAGETPLKDLHEVRPAHFLEFENGELREQRYWQLTSRPHSETFDETARHVRELLETIVARQLTPNDAEGPVGAMLSGGLDSTSVVALAQRQLALRSPGSRLRTVCVHFDDSAASFTPTELRPDVDTPYAQAAAQHIGTQHDTLSVTAGEILDAIPATRRTRDLPGWGQFDGSMYLLFQSLSRSSRVVLTGEFADELFGGYPYFFNQSLVTRDTFPWLDDAPRLHNYLTDEVHRAIRPDDEVQARYRQLLSEVPQLEGEDAAEARMREVFYVGMHGRMAVLLDRMDRLSASLGLQIRYPFCDHQLMEYVWNVPWHMKSQGGVKGLLKSAMADILPDSTVNRKKSAYPHIQNSEYDLSLIKESEALMKDRHHPFAELFDRRKIESLLSDVRERRLGVNGAHVLIQLVESGRWIRDYQVEIE